MDVTIELLPEGILLTHVLVKGLTVRIGRHGQKILNEAVIVASGFLCSVKRAALTMFPKPRSSNLHRGRVSLMHLVSVVGCGNYRPQYFQWANLLFPGDGSYHGYLPDDLAASSATITSMRKFFFTRFNAPA